MDMQADPWAAFNPQPPPAADPGFTGVIPGVPKPPAPKTTYRPLTPDEVKAKGLNSSEAYQISSEGEVKSIGKVPGQKDDAKAQSAMDSTRDLIQSIERARGLVSNWSTGLGGAVGKLYPGSDQANQLDTIVNQELRGNIFKNWVAGLKAESDTGTSGIGRIMQSEIPLVTGSLGALDPVKMGRQGTLDSFDQIENRVLRSAALLNNENPDDPKVLQKYKEQFSPHTKMPAAPSPSGGTGGGGHLGPSGGSAGPSPTDPTEHNVGGFADQQVYTPAGAQEVHDAVYSAIASKQIKSSADLKAFVDRYNQEHRTDWGLDAAAAQPAIDAALKGQKFGVETPLMTRGQKARVDERLKSGDARTKAAAGGVLDTATLGGLTQIGAVGDATTDFLHGKGFDFTGNLNAETDYNRQIRGDHPGFYLGGQLAGGAVLPPLGDVGAAENVGALARIGARTGATYGGVYGLNESAGQPLTDRVTSGVTGAALGGTIGALAPYAGKFAADKIGALRSAKGMAPDVADAAQAEGVDLIRPMVDPSSRGKFGALESAPGSQNVIREGADRIRGQLSAKASALGGDGVPLEPLALGDTTRGVGLRYITQTGAQFNRQYGRLQSAADGVKIPGTQALAETDALIQKLSEFPNENAKEIAYLQGLKQDLSKPLSIDGLRSLRSKMRQSIAKGDLTFGADEARVLGVADAASQDIANGLTAAGKGNVAQQFKELDAAYRDRMGMIQGTIQKLIGKRGQNLSGEQVFNNLKSMAGPRGDASGLTRMLEQMTPEERADVQATFAEAIGKNNKNEFSTATFLAQTDPRKMPRAMRVALFGESGDKSINNLRLLSRKLEEGVGDFNRSKTANGILRQMATKFVGSLIGVGGSVGMLEGGLAGSGTGVATGLLAGGAVRGYQMARNILSARAMVNPRVSQWLAQAATVSTPSQAQQAVKGLSLVISREPALAHELTPIRDFLDQRVGELLAAKPAGADQNNDQQR